MSERDHFWTSTIRNFPGVRSVVCDREDHNPQGQMVRSGFADTLLLPSASLVF